mmetsp:Transcript_6419/g.15192  ORF Transcript_6419/g.15192 Transcript_6419/m.15192 type:complete len:364 (-) Transcript_6419:42-1133(-)
MEGPSRKQEPQRVRLVLVGLGAVNTELLAIVGRKQGALLERHGLEVLCVGASDSRGATLLTEGLDQAALLAHKAERRPLADFPGGVGCEGTEAMLTALGDEGYDVLVDGSPVQLQDGGVGLLAARRALAAGRRVVLANKAPLVVAFDELMRLAAEPAAAGPPAAPRLLYSATVCGGLPVLNVARRDLGVTAAEFSSLEGVFNSTTNYILSEMGEGRDFGAALAEAQRLGIAEADPSLDVDGWDTANKLVIIVNAVLGRPVRLADVAVEGVRSVTPELVAEAKGRGEVYKLVASAEVAEGGELKLTVRPTLLPSAAFLAGVVGWEMGIVLRSDLFEVVSLKIDEPSVVPTSAAVLRDVLHCAGC